MPNRSLFMKLRSLPDGNFQEAQEAGWEGNMLHLTLPDGQMGFSAGVLAEIESESTLYLGEVRQCSGSAMKIMVEHSLDRTRLASLKEFWG
jgi:hypothetical protein